MATASDIINAAFRKVGIEDPTTTQTSQALTSLNDMISLWGADFLVPYLTSESFSLTIGTADYTIGSGGDFDTVRPIKIEDVYLRDGDDYDYPVRVYSYKDYNDLYLKTLEGRPTKCCLLPEYPLAKIYFDREIDEAYDAYFTFWKNFTEFAATSTSVSLPNEYKAALVYNLAVSLAEDWDRKVNQTLYVMAKESKEIIERLNASNRIIPKAKFDIKATGTLNIETDRYE